MPGEEAPKAGSRVLCRHPFQVHLDNELCYQVRTTILHQKTVLVLWMSNDLKYQLAGGRFDLFIY